MKNKLDKENIRKIIEILISFLIFLLAVIIKLEYISIVLYIISYLIVGADVIKEFLNNILKGKVFGENFLMCIATLGAFLIGEKAEAVMVMLLYQIGELLQDYAIDKSKRRITELMDIKIEYANLFKNGKIKKVAPESILIGDIIVVKKGERIPLDGIVIEGTSYLDTSSLTGEAMPLLVEKNTFVLSGSINNGNVIKIKVTSLYKNSTVNKILDLVENVSERKSHSENIINKLAVYYTKTVVIIAILLLILLPIITDISIKTSLIKSLTFLVISCPCALVISIPLCFFSAIGCGSKMGILIKGSNYIEKLNKTDTIIFDKTGTLTKGQFKIEKIVANEKTKEKMLELASYTEYYSNHPIAKVIKDAYKKDIDLKKISNFEEIIGMGIKCTVDKDNILLGNEKLLNKYHIKYPKNNELGTVLYMAINGKYEGYILINDELKENSKDVIKTLKKLGIKKIVMLTGDIKSIGENIAKNLKIDEVYTELLPQDKVSILDKIKKDNELKNIIYVGDGLNDAPVLVFSDVGISMGQRGSDSAIEASDVVIMEDNLDKIVTLLKLSKKTMKILYENIIFALVVKFLILFFSLFCTTSMWMAVFADVGVTLILILNSLRLLYTKE